MHTYSFIGRSLTSRHPHPAVTHSQEHILVWEFLLVWLVEQFLRFAFTNKG